MPFQPALCPKCSASIQVPDDVAGIKCMYCGADIDVRTAIALLTGKTANNLELARAANKGGNHTEAVAYYNKSLEQDPTNWRVWMEKGECTGWLSTLGSDRLNEMWTCFDKALQYSGSDTHTANALIADTAHKISACIYMASRNHMLEYVSLDGAWQEHVGKTDNILLSLDRAHALKPNDADIINQLVTICRENIEGVAYKDAYDPQCLVNKDVHITPDQEQKYRTIMNRYARKLEALVPGYTTPEPTKASGGCFVVTASYGDDCHDNVVFLRDFRDRSLRGTSVGDAFIAWYYKHGPFIAKAIRNSPSAQAVCRTCIVRPAIAIINLIKRSA